VVEVGVVEAVVRPAVGAVTSASGPVPAVVGRPRRVTAVARGDAAVVGRQVEVAGYPRGGGAAGHAGDERRGCVHHVQDEQVVVRDRKSTRLNSSHANISYAV